MKLIINTDKAKIENGKVIIDCSNNDEMVFKIIDKENIEADFGWLRITKNDTLNIIRIK